MDWRSQIHGWPPSWPSSQRQKAALWRRRTGGFSFSKFGRLGGQPPMYLASSIHFGCIWRWSCVYQWIFLPIGWKSEAIISKITSHDWLCNQHQLDNTKTKVGQMLSGAREASFYLAQHANFTSRSTRTLTGSTGINSIHFILGTILTIALSSSSFFAYTDDNMPGNEM